MSRLETLKRGFNAYWQEALDTKEDLFSKMDVEKLVKLKKAVSNVNNILTLETTNSFIKLLLEDGVISAEQYQEMMNAVDSVNANANGFDAESMTYVKLVAEVKCNIPVEESSFGPAQIDGIVKDIENLNHGKNKSKIPKNQMNEYLKFMVFLDSEKVYVSAKKLVEKLANRRKNPITNVEFYKRGGNLSLDIVYIVLVSPDLTKGQQGYQR